MAINKLLYPAAALYGITVKFRNLLFDKGIFRSSEFDVPVINVGNISAGGNGKTPHVEYLASLLLEQNRRIAVLSRGYGRKTKGFREVTAGGTPSENGDEPLQIKRKFGDKLKVFAGEKRVDAILKIMDTYPDTDVILLDDAFQHRAVKAGLNLLLTDYNRLFTSDALLPAGRLREGKSGASRADAIIVTKCPENITEKEKSAIRQKLEKYCNTVLFSRFEYGKPYGFLNTGKTDTNNNFFVVTGIAKPGPMIDYAGKNFDIAGIKTFPDHHRFTAKDISGIEKLTAEGNKKPAVLTTTKDAVRFWEIHRKTKFGFPVYVLPVEVKFEKDDEDKFNKMVLDFAGKT